MTDKEFNKIRQIKIGLLSVGDILKDDSTSKDYTITKIYDNGIIKLRFTFSYLSFRNSSFICYINKKDIKLSDNFNILYFNYRDDVRLKYHQLIK